MSNASRLVLAFALFCVPACQSSMSHDLRVDLRTDYAAVVEFDSVSVVLRGVGEERDPLEAGLLVQRIVGETDRFVPGARVARFSDLAPGQYAVEATLFRGGAALESRRVLVSMRGAHGVTVAISRSCNGIVCPGPDDPADATQCLAGRCVPEGCTPETLDACGDVDCLDDSGCPSTLACATPRCLEGHCWNVVSVDACPEGEWCDPDFGGCAPIGASMPDASLPECIGAEDCDDGNPCTDDSCIAGSCVNGNNTAECDDGIYCNGADTCEGGSCSVHSGSPCRGMMLCDEGMGACTGCGNDADCPAESTSAWSACMFSMDECDETGTRQRTRTSNRCVAGVCTAEDTVEMGSCGRDTDGVVCGSSMTGAWTDCAGYATTCDETGTRRRTITDRKCVSGACADVPRMVTGSCSRDTDGDECGGSRTGAWETCTGFSTTCDETGYEARTVTDRTCMSGSCADDPRREFRSCSRVTRGINCGTNLFCCGGACTDITSDTNCGACGVNCTTAGMTCREVSRRLVVRYTCGTCVGSAECPSVYDGEANCWDDPEDSSPKMCQCQCPGGSGTLNVICPDAGCGPGMYCYDCPGLNWCSPVPPGPGGCPAS